MSRVHEVILVRHAESVANASGRFAYRSWDPHLTERGHQQAASLANQLVHLPIAHLVSSPLIRAQETLVPLASALGLDAIVLPELIEVNLGRWDGAVVEDLRVSDREAFVAWRSDPEAFPPPDGESVLTVGRRVLRALETFLADRNPAITVAATHADCVKGALLTILAASGASARQLSVPNTALVRLQCRPDGRWSVAFFTPDSLA